MSKNELIDTVIFDMDGLLIDSEVAFLATYNELLQPYGYSLSKEEYIDRYCGKTLKDNAVAMQRDYALDITSDVLEQLMIDTEGRKAREGYDLKPGAQLLLDHLKEHGYKIILATSSTMERAKLILENSHVLSYFDAMVFGDDVAKGRGKPHPDVFLKALEKASAKPEEALVLEDSQLGIEAAHNAGIAVIGIPDLVMIDTQHREIAATVYDTLEDVVGFLEASQ